MPELPEVETIVQAVRPHITGQRITAVHVLLPRIIKNMTAQQFMNQLTGQMIQTINRRGKYLIIFFPDNLRLVIHLRMTGRLYYMPSSEPLDRFSRIVFTLDNGYDLRFGDVRTLGTVHLLDESELCTIHGLHCLGMEPLSDGFTPEYLKRQLSGSKRTIKAVLLDQSIIAGLGNIYVDESLAVAHVHPERIGSSLSWDEIGRLHHAIIEVLREGLEHGGTSFRDYRNAQGRPGDHQHYLYVYGRDGQSCRFCGRMIVKKVVAGRGTHYCPHCQPLDE